MKREREDEEGEWGHVGAEGFLLAVTSFEK